MRDDRYMNARPLVALLLVLSSLAGCGARSSLPAPAVDAGDDGADDASAMRICAPSCTVGHRCCLGDCDGPAVPTENDCCSCLAGEVSSTECPNAACGD
ncbi:Hypothetical protein A7982_00594 [Minicystis rosea]|nr:Hypothetical protein A7982_00594 [Minicystis rosea]